MASRGLAGIDGCVSTAIGIWRLAVGSVPTYALLGDLTFLHDVTGLVVGPHEPQPDLTSWSSTTTAAGSSARSSPVHRSTPTCSTASSAPRTAPTSPASAQGAGVEHVSVETAGELAAEVGAAPRGLRVVEVRGDRSAQRSLREQLAAAAVQALTRR